MPQTSNNKHITADQLDTALRKVKTEIDNAAGGGGSGDLGLSVVNGQICVTYDTTNQGS